LVNRMGGRGRGANGDEQAGGASGAGEKTRKHVNASLL
jgi:hypothetical protein